MNRLILFAFLFVFSWTLLAQTPEQPYFEWTNLPFTNTELLLRRENLMAHLYKQDKTGLVIIPARDGFSSGETFRQADDFYYFTGLELPNSLLVLDLAQGSAVIYAPEKDKRFVSNTRPNDFPGRTLLKDPSISDKSGLALKNITEFSNLVEKAAQISIPVWINSGRRGTVSIAAMDYIARPSPEEWMVHVMQLRHPGLRFNNSYTDIAQTRMVKSPAEIDLLRKATSINVEGIKAAAKKIRPGVDERYLEGILEGSYKVNGAQRLAFGSIIKSGPNSLWPWRILATHYNRRNRVMNAGELVIFDVGCEFNQYVSDVGRTFPVSGEFTETQRLILQMEVDIADQIIAMIRPGITFADIKAMTDKIIPQEAKKYMQVGLHFGHHLGLSTGDPNLEDAPLAEGMVFTVEPWYYNHDEQISVFTEDVIVVTKTGSEILSKNLPRTPEDLELLMRE